MTSPSVSDIYMRARPMNSGCIEFQGAISSSTGYGKIRFEGKPVDTHRATWIAAHGPIPAGMYVCHTCDNRKCIRLTHLFLGTHSDNMKDAARKGRLPENFKRGSASPSAKLTEAQVIAIYDAVHRGESTKALALKYGTTHQRVSAIRYRQTWRDLLDRHFPLQSTG